MLLLKDKDFTDVTLVCEDGKQVDAHKVVLANSSPFFQKILRKNRHNHPLIYTRVLKSNDLLAIVDFLYCGEANVYQENLNAFLVIAEEFQLKGLMGKSDKDEEVQEETFPKSKVKPIHKKEPSDSPSWPNFLSEQKANSASDALGRHVALTNQSPLSDFEELDTKCISLMEKTSRKNAHTQPLYQCKVCGKEEINGAIKSHIESNHLDISIPCNFCEKTFRSRNALRQHKMKHQH